MKNIAVIVLCTVIVLLGCEKQVAMEEYFIPEVIYISSKDFLNETSCFSLSNIEVAQGFVIDKASEYENLTNELRFSFGSGPGTCDSASLIEINFDAYTLVAIKTIYGACDSISKDFSIDNSQSTITYSIDIKRMYNACDNLLVLDINTALIPKIPSDYSVNFNIFYD